MRYFLLAFIVAVALVVGIAGSRGKLSRKPPIEVFPDMDRQPKIRPQTASAFFADGRASRLPVEGTVARGSAFLEAPINTGLITGTTNFVAVNPLKVTPELMARGQQRYQIYCAPCHSPLGDRGVCARAAAFGARHTGGSRARRNRRPKDRCRTIIWLRTQQQSR